LNAVLSIFHTQVYTLWSFRYDRGSHKSIAVEKILINF